MSWAIWITGPPASGKSAIAQGVVTELRARGQAVKWLELDVVRESVTPIPRYTDSERDLVYRALGYMATLLVEAGRPVIIDATGHRRVWRDLVRAAVRRFGEVQLMCPIATCRERERTRAIGQHAPRNIYAKAGQPGATVPGVDIPYEAALAPELVIDTTADSVVSSVEQVVRLAERLMAEAGADTIRTVGDGQPGWAVWITGRPGSGKSTLARRVCHALREQGACAQLLDLVRVQAQLLGGQPSNDEQQDLIHRVLAYAAKLLTEAGICVIVDATAGRRAWRQAARDLIPCFAEIQLLCPVEICLERERAVRWGLAFETAGIGVTGQAPDIRLGYEESERPDLTLRTDVFNVQSAVDLLLATIERLAQKPSRAAGAL